MRIAEAVIVLAIVLVIGGSVILERWRIVPPEGVRTLEDFIREMRPAAVIAEVSHEGKPCVLWIGQVEFPNTFPSGPPCYLFDRKGNLLDWQYETGEGGGLDVLVKEARKGKTLSVEEALSFVR
jgi:hypothetical protein